MYFQTLFVLTSSFSAVREQKESSKQKEKKTNIQSKFKFIQIFTLTAALNKTIFLFHPSELCN
jgi:hypothetical protein